MKYIVLAITAVFAGGLVGCASTPDNLQRETARSIGGLTSDQVTVSEVERGATNVSWKATTPSGHYNCEADDMVRRVNCVKNRIFKICVPIARPSCKHY